MAAARGQDPDADEVDSLTNSREFRAFKSTVSLQEVVLGDDRCVWKYFDYGPRTAPTLVCMPGVSGTAEVFYKQIVSLSSQGVRVVATQYPSLPYRMDELVVALDRFVQHLRVKGGKVHLVGVGLGGFVWQMYAHSYPSSVASITLINSYCDTTHFFNSSTCLPVIEWMPAFMLKQQILANFPQGQLEVDILRSVDFMVEQLDKLTQKELITRILLTCAPSDMQPVPLPDGSVMIVDVCDEISIPTELTEEVYKFYPNARVANLKDGGNFPHLSRSDEVNMYLLVHLRSLHVLETALEREANPQPRETVQMTDDGMDGGFVEARPTRVASISKPFLGKGKATADDDGNDGVTATIGDDDL